MSDVRIPHLGAYFTLKEGEYGGARLAQPATSQFPAVCSDVLSISTCACVRWKYCIAANFPEIVVAWFPPDSEHHAANSIKTHPVSSDDASFGKNTCSLSLRNAHQDGKLDA